MSIQEIIRRGFKNEVSFSYQDLSRGKGYQIKDCYRLKEKEDSVCLEYKWVDIQPLKTTTPWPYHVVGSWSLREKHPIGINIIPNEKKIVIKFSDGSIGRLDKLDSKNGNEITEIFSADEAKKAIETLSRLKEAALEDNVITDTERSALIGKAKSLGLDPREINMTLDSELSKRKKEKEDHIMSLNPQNKEEALEALVFLQSLLPSSSLEEIANRKFRLIFVKAKNDYCSDAVFLQRLAIIQNDYNNLHKNAIRDKRAIIRKILIRRISNVVFLTVLLLEWLLIKGWGWSVTLNIITLLVFGIVALKRGDSISDYKKSLSQINTIIEKYRLIE